MLFLSKREGLPGHGLDTPKRDQMSEMEHMNVMEVAVACVTKPFDTPSLWVSFPARFVRPNRCKIAVSDLERFIPGPPPGPVQAAAAENWIAMLGDASTSNERKIR